MTRAPDEGTPFGPMITTPIRLVARRSATRRGPGPSIRSSPLTYPGAATWTRSARPSKRTAIGPPGVAGSSVTWGALRSRRPVSRALASAMGSPVSASTARRRQSPVASAGVTTARVASSTGALSTVTSRSPGGGRSAAPGRSAGELDAALRPPGASSAGRGSVPVRRPTATQSAAATSSARSGPLLVVDWPGERSGVAAPTPAILARRHDRHDARPRSSSVYRARMLERPGCPSPRSPRTWTSGRSTACSASSGPGSPCARAPRPIPRAARRVAQLLCADQVGSSRSREPAAPAPQAGHADACVAQLMALSGRPTPS